MMSNRKNGNAFESDLCEMLFQNGYWAHNLAQNKQGQPFDVIAAKNGKTYPIDCKDCSKDVFKIDRIEQNQYSAMMLWQLRGNGCGWFALRLSNGDVFFITLNTLLKLSGVRKTLPESLIRDFGIPLKEWVKQCD